MAIATLNRSTRHGWDRIEPESLLQLVGVRTTTDRHGKLLRHYWLPDTVLTYRSNCEQNGSDGHFTVKGQTFTKRQVYCDADSCTWRQRLISNHEHGCGFIDFTPPLQRECFCVYNRSEQTFRTQPILSHSSWPNASEAARVQAFLQQPVLAPLLPIPVGFQWYCEADGGYLEFTLESELLVGDMPVVFVRRQGEFWMDGYFQHGEFRAKKLRLRREGVTAFAAERSVVLQDKVHDTVVEAEDDRLLGLETRSEHTLVRSELLESKPVAPLQFQYGTSSGRNYLYDHGTSRIIRINLADFSKIVDDFQKLNPLEIYEKHSEIAPERITESLCEIERLRGCGYLTDHKPVELCHVDKIVFKNKLHSIGDFNRDVCSLLVLGLTERCNLDCTYCCFGGKFAAQRTHSHRSMSPEIAKKAIDDYLAQENISYGGYYPISFYGGEPLLEWSLLTECVEHAKAYCETHGKKARFALTTNGTLLDDAICDYLVENDFLILVSLDGPQNVHDRYRVFPNGKGSYETVYENLKRFVERYPKYTKRGLNFTLAPPFDWEEMEKFVEETFHDFPLSRVGLVNAGAIQTENSNTATRYGCHTVCNKNVGNLESFQNFRPEDREKLETLWKECVENLANLGSVEARRRNPFSTHLFEGQLEAYHKRSVQPKPSECDLFVPCMPGFVRRFCDVDGNYRVCERVDDSHAYRVGNVWAGLDPEKLEYALELRRHFGDCANCISLKTCDLCYARIPHSDDVAEGFDPMFDLTCQKARETDKKMYTTYTEIMERNPAAFDHSGSANQPDSRPIHYATQNKHLSESIMDKLRCEK